jgi:FdhD protein
MPNLATANEFERVRIRPDPTDLRLTVKLSGTDQTGATVVEIVPVERPLTLFLNRQEIVIAITIGNYPQDIAVGYFLNQGRLLPDDIITGIDYGEQLSVVAMRTEPRSNYEEKLRKKTQASDCALDTAFGDLMDVIEVVCLPVAELRTSWLNRLNHAINTMPSLYPEVGAIHGAVLCCCDDPLIYMEDVGRQNAVDKFAGHMYRHGTNGAHKVFTPPDGSGKGASGDD